jgi:hypothetical protein
LENKERKKGEPRLCNNNNMRARRRIEREGSRRMKRKERDREGKLGKSINFNEFF